MPRPANKKPKSLVPRRRVPKPRHTKIPGVVLHPRYGDTVVSTEWATTEKEVKDSFWGYRKEEVFPESAIPADTSRQKFTVIPRGYYVDILKRCRSCHRPFIFFAREQQHWFEVLGFNIDADCVRCCECRKSEQQLRRRFMRYSQAVNCSDLDDSELATLVEDAVFLFDAAVLRDEQRLRRLRNVARRRIPGSTALAKIDRVIIELKSRIHEIGPVGEGIGGSG